MKRAETARRVFNLGPESAIMVPGGPRRTSRGNEHMKFVEITGETLLELAAEEQVPGLRASGVTEQSKVRINPQGDIEIHHNGGWSIIGGLLGDYENRIRKLTGLDWS
jgi:hypothetical protein